MAVKNFRGLAVAGFVSVAITGFATPAFAQNTSGVYVGGGAGASKMHDLADHCNKRLPAMGVATTGCDDRSVAWKGFGGYQFVRYFGVEVGYYDFGKGSAKTANSGNIDYKARGIYAGAVITAPLTERVNFIARAGALRWTSKVRPNPTIGIAAVSDDGFSPAFGLGLEYMFTDHFGMRAEWERFTEVGSDGTTGETQVNLYSVSGVLKF